ncbi:hypothetical protein GCM10018773_34390 [Streptomyces candidus]|nr:hypothetical protein GCM10018773_34390 [Streptomyces candidus]
MDLLTVHDEAVAALTTPLNEDDRERPHGPALRSSRSDSRPGSNGSASGGDAAGPLPEEAVRLLAAGLARAPADALRDRPVEPDRCAKAPVCSEVAGQLPLPARTKELDYSAKATRAPRPAVRGERYSATPRRSGSRA